MRKTTAAILTASFAATAIGCASVAQESPASGHAHHSAAEPVERSVDLINSAGTKIGTVDLKQGASGLLLVVKTGDLTPGWHGIHIHETGTCEGPFTSAGSHVNHADAKVPHGLLNPAGPDDGDLPNIFADANGSANAELFTSRVRLSEHGHGQWLLDENGSAIVIHAKPDDHSSQPIGGAGDRVACAVIK